MNLADGELYNLHCHTQFCDGRSTMQQFVEAAIALGYHTLGFSPHGPTCVESKCNMKHADVDAYLEEIGRLRDIAGNRLRILAGMEIDYINPEYGPHSDYYRTLPLDYRIGSVHFIPNQYGEPVDVDGRFSRFKHSMAEYFRNDIEYVVTTYFSQLGKMIELGGFDILGHLDKISRNASLYAPGIEDSKTYQDEIAKIITLIDRKNFTVEINTKISESSGRTFPNRRHWLNLAKQGTKFCINSDSHEAEKLDSGRASTLKALTELSIIFRSPHYSPQAPHMQEIEKS